MGSKTVQSNEPWSPAKPYILQGLQNSGRVFDSTQPQLEGYAANQRDTYGRLAPGAEEGIMASQGLANRMIAGDYLHGNPYIDGVRNAMVDDVGRGVNSAFTSAGRYGSGAHTSVLSRELARASNDLNFNNYAMERQNQIGAMGTAQDLMRGSQSILDNAADLPWRGVGALNGNVRQASGGYGTTTTRQPFSPMQFLGNAAQSAAMAYGGR